METIKAELIRFQVMAADGFQFRETHYERGDKFNIWIMHTKGPTNPLRWFEVEPLIARGVLKKLKVVETREEEM